MNRAELHVKTPPSGPGRKGEHRISSPLSSGASSESPKPPFRRASWSNRVQQADQEAQHALGSFQPFIERESDALGREKVMERGLKGGRRSLKIYQGGLGSKSS
jgi:hypothetical protein